MIQKIIHSVWLGPNPPLDDCYLSRWEFCPPETWDRKFWMGEEQIREGLGLEPWQYEHSTKAGMSNIIRLHAVYQYGGIYTDHDVMLIKPLDPLLEHSACVCRQKDKILCNAVFGATPKHPWIKAMIDNYGDQRIHDAAYACHLMEPHLTPDVTILPTDVFYPFNWNEPPKPPTERTIGIHLWNGSWLKKEEK